MLGYSRRCCPWVTYLGGLMYLPIYLMLKFVYSEKAKKKFLCRNIKNWEFFFQFFVALTNFNGLNVLLLTLEFSAYFSSPNILPNRKLSHFPNPETEIQLKGVNFPGSQNPQFCRLVIHRSRHLLKPVRFKINIFFIRSKNQFRNYEFS